MYIGVVGTAVAGKSTAAGILEEFGFRRVGLSDILREKLKARKLALNEETLYAIGNELRLKFGPAAIMREAINSSEGRTVFDCIHGMGELDWLVNEGGLIVGIDADPRTRYDRAIERVERGRHENYGSLQDFLAQELRDVDRDVFRCNPSELLERADVIIRNDGAIDDLRKELGAWLSSLDGLSSGTE